MSVPRIILASLSSFCQKLSKLVEIWLSSDKNNFAQFLRHGVQYQYPHLVPKFVTQYLVPNPGNWYLVFHHDHINYHNLTCSLIFGTSYDLAASTSTINLIQSIYSKSQMIGNQHNFLQQLEDFLREPEMDWSTEPLNWWAANSSHYPKEMS